MLLAKAAAIHISHAPGILANRRHLVFQGAPSFLSLPFLPLRFLLELADSFKEGFGANARMN